MRFKFTSEDGKTETVFNPKKSAERREMAAKIASGEIGNGKFEITIGHGKNVRAILFDGFSVAGGCKKA